MIFYVPTSSTPQLLNSSIFNLKSCVLIPSAARDLPFFLKSCDVIPSLVPNEMRDLRGTLYFGDRGSGIGKRQGSKAARQQGSKAARQQGSKAARQQGSKAARQQGTDYCLLKYNASLLLRTLD
jgi:hypothetical protein